LQQQLVTRFRGLPAGPVLADHLVERGLLTRFQADELLRNERVNLVLGVYELRDVIGVGSMGTVYQARSRTDGKRYAVKLLPRRDMWSFRLTLRFVRAFSPVKHPAVVALTDAGTVGGQHYLVWPFVMGETLVQQVEQHGPLLPEAAAYHGLCIAEALAACAEHALFHGQLNAANVVVDSDGEPRVLDFGIGVLLSRTRPDERELVHTAGQASLWTSGLDCASPESILDPSRRSVAGDQYSLGCVMYYALTGRYPFDGPAVLKMQAHQQIAPVSVRERRSEVPEALAVVVERLLRKSPEDRFRTPEDIIDVLRPLAQKPSQPTAPEEPDDRPQRLDKLKVSLAAPKEPKGEPTGAMKEPLPADEKRAWPTWLWPLALGVSVLAVGAAVGFAAAWMLMVK
jgi:serine/threonine-protein kinase